MPPPDPPTTPEPPPAKARREWGSWPLALLLATAVFSLLLYENRQYLFATRLYENTDWASDSLMVREAKHTFLLHGHYSQWRFYHPGPALLDTLAAGEALFYDDFHLVPTPYNGQLILLCLVLTLFFGFALATFARELGPRRGRYLFFLPLALVFAVWHYGSVGGAVFLDAWPAYPPVMALLCFLTATAAVAAGRGEQLPLVVVTGGWLVHNHVAQPLLVVPLTLLSYAGLSVACRRGPGTATPWRIFPWSHRVAAFLLALFVLPLGLDLLSGSQSNFAHVLAFLREQPEPHRKFVRALCYFLTFGGYAPYQPGTRDFSHYSAPGMLHFVLQHRAAYASWLVALLGTPTLLFAAYRSRKRQAPVDGGVPGANRFLAWFCVLLAVTFGLSLLWAQRQQGPMYYYNTFFNYSIFFGLALVFAAALAAALAAWTLSPAARPARVVLSALLWAAVGGSVFLEAGHFQVSAFGTAEDAAAARAVADAAASLPKNALCYLDCRPWENWTVTAAVLLELERLGYKARVNDNWEIIFGNPNTVQHETLTEATPLARWRVETRTAAPLRDNERPLYPHSLLDLLPLAPLDPNGQAITFATTGNADDYAVYGWSAPDADWTWSDQTTALLVFRPLPLAEGSEGVDVVIDAWSPLPPPPGKIYLQRAALRFNDADLGTFPLPLDAPGRAPLHVRIGAAQWQAAQARGEARLQFRFPDAVSPASLGLGNDRRLLGGGFRRVTFQTVPPPAGAAPEPPSH